MSLLQVEMVDQVAVVKLDHGVTNALSRQLVAELGDALNQVRQDPAVRGLVLSSVGDRFFCIGLDLPDVYDLPRDEFADYFRAFGRVCMDLYTLPKPTVAALTGHALAGGCILALCCDYRLMAEGRKLMGLNEVKLGVPVPYLGDCILRQLVGARHAREVTGTGEFFPPEEALCLGLVDQVLPPAEVLPQAIAKAQALGALPAAAFAMIKRNRTEPVTQQWDAHLTARDEAMLDLWYAPEARALLKAAREKF
ncbi:MAG: enoyl-CoA hydratase/isomerase family protein [Chloroflexi bacterium]|nr:enoyl-CoA hydratase/isomerase family protein [Chloroflexota bacterium]MBU1750317.1 enoyl-CoA hydratase/isomerase family protein [Chloroflexota bacterium]